MKKLKKINKSKENKYSGPVLSIVPLTTHSTQFLSRPPIPHSTYCPFHSVLTKDRNRKEGDDPT